jgi:hypothetical protein
LIATFLLELAIGAFREIHRAHPPRPDWVENPVVTDELTDTRILLLRARPGEVGGERIEVCLLVAVREQRLDLVAQGIIVPARCRHEGRAISALCSSASATISFTRCQRAGVIRSFPLVLVLMIVLVIAWRIAGNR